MNQNNSTLSIAGEQAIKLTHHLDLLRKAAKYYDGDAAVLLEAHAELGKSLQLMADAKRPATARSNPVASASLSAADEKLLDQAGLSGLSHLDGCTTSDQAKAAVAAQDQ